MSDCMHHWVCESQRNRMTLGRCKKCGEERIFEDREGIERHNFTLKTKPTVARRKIYIKDGVEFIPGKYTIVA